MAPNCGKKAAKHKLTEEKAKNSNCAKKTKFTVPKKEHSAASKHDDSSIGTLASMKKKSTNQKESRAVGKPSSKKCLKIANVQTAPDSTTPPVDVSSMDVSQILALGEGTSSSEPYYTTGVVASDSDDTDWEEVAEKPELKEPVIPEQGVNITLEGPIVSFKRKKREIDLEGEVRRQLKRRQKEIQELMHKVHLLCWIAHAKRVNFILNSESLLKESHQLVASKNFYPPKHADLDYLERIVKIFHKHVLLKEDAKPGAEEEDLVESLQSQFKLKVATSKKSLVYMFIVFLRGLGLKVRLILNLVTVPLKPSGEKSCQITPKSSQAKSKTTASSTLPSPSNTSSQAKNDTTASSALPSSSTPSPSKGLKASLVSNLKGLSSTQSEKCLKKNLGKNLKYSKNESKKKVAEETKRKQTKADLSKKMDELCEDSDDEPLSKHFKTKATKIDPHSPGPSKATPLAKKRPAPKKVAKEPNSDDDFSPKPLIPQKKKLDRRVLSSDDDTLAVDTSKKTGQNFWIEVFLEAEEKWITVDIVKQKVHCVKLLQVRATQPVAYVLACNNDLTLKDVTKRYAPNWHSDTRKKRVAEAWWEETMWPYLPPSSAQEKEEDEDIARQLHDMPLPRSISEYKFHPLYALKRHLLKFEGIYPPEAPTLGFIRGEPVYGRECVVTLRSRDIWFKEARVVRLNETPYKIVKSRPKYDKMTGDFKKDLPLELFGVWQTEDYIPPIAVDGKVPRNEYGNVDLFKPCMLPGGTVHLQIPALNRVARKLGIDCAPAVVGFEFHAGGSHPVHDGFVVCEEFKEKLLDAWNKEIDESARRAEERLEKRVYGNWRRLIRGLLIRENLKMKYSFGVNSDDDSSQPSTSEPPQPSTTTAASVGEPPKKKPRRKFALK